MAVNTAIVLAAVWFLKGVIVTIYTVSIYELVRRYQFFKEGKSPLFYCYIFVVLGGTALIADGMGELFMKRLPVFFELALAFLFTSYSLTVYTWVLIILELKYMRVRTKWHTVTHCGYIALNCAIYISAMVSGIYPDFVYVPIYLISFTLCIAYLVAFLIFKTYFSKVTSRSLTVLSRVTNRVIILHILILVSISIIASAFPSHIHKVIKENYPYLFLFDILYYILTNEMIKSTFVAEVLVLIYNLRKMSKTPTARMSANPSICMVQVDSSSPSNSLSHPLNSSIRTTNMEMSNTPPFVSADSPLAILDPTEKSHSVSTQRMRRSNSDMKIGSSHKTRPPIVENSFIPHNPQKLLSPATTRTSIVPSLSPSPPNRDPTTYFESYTFPSTNLGTSQTSQVFTNISAFNLSMSHPENSPGVSQVFQSTYASSFSTSPTSNLSLASFITTPRAPAPAPAPAPPAPPASAARPSLTSSNPRASVSASSITFNPKSPPTTPTLNRQTSAKF